MRSIAASIQSLRVLCSIWKKDSIWKKRLAGKRFSGTLIRSSRPLPSTTSAKKDKNAMLKARSATAGLKRTVQPRRVSASSQRRTNVAHAGLRTATVKRQTKETKIELTINIDGTGVCHSKSQIPFLDHMMDQLASHGLFDIHLEAEGDTWIDDHHTNEDIALALGTALSQALGDRKGINRFGHFAAPLDEALVDVVLDLSGRPHLSCSLDLPTERIGNYETQLVEHFFQSMANTSGMTLHIRQLDGRNRCVA